MTLHDFVSTYNEIYDVKIIGKEIILKGKVCEVMALAMREGSLKLFVAEYDERQSEIKRQNEELYEEYSSPQTVRQREKEHVLTEHSPLSHNAITVTIGDTTYEISGGDGTELSLEHYVGGQLVSRFLSEGWRPLSIGDMPFDDIDIFAMQIEGDYTQTPKFEDNAPIKLEFRDEIKTTFIEKQFSASIGDETCRKVYLDDSDFVNIKSVERYDILPEIMKRFEDPRLIEHYSKAELEGLKSDMQKRILNACPKGCTYLLVGYESSTGDRVSIHSRDYLEGDKRDNGGMGFSYKSDEVKHGELGLPLFYELVAEPFGADVESVTLEVFSRFTRVKQEDITL